MATRPPLSPYRVDTCIIPIITYGAETNIPTQTETNQLQSIIDNILKRILKVPKTTPSDILIIETGIKDIETRFAKKQISYYHKIKTGNPETNLLNISTNEKNQWNKHIQKVIQKFKINHDELLNMTKTQAKRYIDKQANIYQQEKIMHKAESKSKTLDLVIHKTKEQLTTRPPYMNSLTRKECTNIFVIRSRMMKIKGNYKNSYTDLKCRWCNETNQIETQQHVLSRCKGLSSITKNRPYPNYFKDDQNNIKLTNQIMTELNEKIENTE